MFRIARRARRGSAALLMAAVPLVAFAPPAAAQSAARVTGTVVDAADGTPLEGALVQLEGTDRVTVTGPDGGFALLDVSPGDYVLYVSIVGYRLARRRVTAGAQEAPLTVRLARGTGTYEEEVTVQGEAILSTGTAVPAQTVLGPAEMQNLKGVLADDPMRAVQVAPGVATGDDFRAEFSIRGSDPRNIGLSLDGVPNVLFLHEDQGAGDTASVALINGDLVEEVSIAAGSYPQRFGDRTGAQVDFTTRSGSRARTQVRAAASASTASVVGEGPLGTRGSWLAGFRQSYLGWLIRQVDADAEGTANFTDGQTNLVFDLTPRQQLRFNFVAGALRRSENDDTPSINSDETGASDVGIANVSWWWQAADSAFLVQRLYWAGNRFTDRNYRGDLLNRGALEDVGYRGDLSWEAADELRFEGGWSATRQHGEASIYDYDRATGEVAASIESAADATAAGGYAQLRWIPAAAFSVNFGGRVDRWNIVGATEVSPWVQAQWRVSDGLTLRAASGMYRQAPDLQRALGPRGNPDLLPERAFHVDVGAAGGLLDWGSWQVNGYDRKEYDVTRLEGSEVRVVNGELVRDDFTNIWQNALTGHSRGVEVVIRRDRAVGFSGWFSYAYTRTRYRDSYTGEEFWGDYDQRHTLNLWGKYRFTNRLELSGKLRVGSNFPLAGYYREGGTVEAANRDREDRYFISDVRNQARLPLYARLDVRANYAFNFTRSRLTLFVEIINLLNRKNYGPTDPGFINPTTLRVNGLLEELFPFLPTAGILWEF
ncbi:MAG: TonB-dependent receptor [Acidobacteriota bacterium]|jgi:hypothetical protein